MGLRKLWALVGMGTIAQGSRSRRRLAGGGIEFVHARVEEIDPAARTVRADGRAWQPSRRHAEHKRRFETERLARWFGG